MSKKNKPDNKGFVFSTDPNFKFEEEENSVQETVAPKQQTLRMARSLFKAITAIKFYNGY